MRRSIPVPVTETAMVDLPALPQSVQRVLALRWANALDAGRLTGRHLFWHEEERKRRRRIAAQSHSGGSPESQHAVDHVGIEESIAVAQRRFNELAAAYWNVWYSSGAVCEVFEQWLRALEQQVLKELASVWEGGSEAVCRWYAKACAPALETALRLLLTERKLQARTAELQRLEGTSAKGTADQGNRGTLSEQPDFLERVSPEDPNYAVAKHFYITSWAASHGLVADAYAGKISLSDFVGACAKTFEQGVQLHLAFKDEASIPAICREIDQMLAGFIRKFDDSLSGAGTKLGKNEVNAAIKEFARRVNETASRGKQELMLRALNAGAALNEADNDQTMADGGGISPAQVSVPGSIPSQQSFGVPRLDIQRSFPPSRHSFTGGPSDPKHRSDLYEEIGWLARELQVLEGPPGQSPREATDRLLDRVTGEKSGEVPVENVLDELRKHCRASGLHHLETGEKDLAAALEGLAAQCDALRTRYLARGFQPSGPATLMSPGSVQAALPQLGNGAPLSARDAAVCKLVGETNFRNLTNSEIMRDPSLRKGLRANFDRGATDAIKCSLDRIRRANFYPLSRDITKKRSSHS